MKSKILSFVTISTIILTLACKPAQKYCAINFGNPVAWNDSLYNLVAQYDMFLYQAVSMFSESDPSQTGVVDSLRQRNPEIIIGAYLPVHHVYQWAKNSYEQYGTSSLAGDWWHEMVIENNFLAYTTENDTASTFNNNYMINLITPGCIDSFFAVLKRHTTNNSNNQTNMFFMLDYFSNPQTVFLSGAYANNTHGEIDLNNNGIPQITDYNEQQQYKQAQINYITKLREQFPNWKLIGNGPLPLTDKDVDSLLDGFYIEGGFQYNFGNKNYFRNALIDTGTYNIFKKLKWLRPGGYSLYEYKLHSTENYNQIMPIFFNNMYGVILNQNEDRTLTPIPTKYILGFPKSLAYTRQDTLIKQFSLGTAKLICPNTQTPSCSFSVVYH